MKEKNMRYTFVLTSKREGDGIKQIMQLFFCQKPSADGILISWGSGALEN